MRVSALTAGLFLTTVIVTGLAGVPAQAYQAKVTCLCDCPDDHKVKSSHVVRPMPARRAAVRRVVRRFARGGYYSYGGAAVAGPMYAREWHGAWRVAPNDAVLPGPMPGPAPMAYYPPPPMPGPYGEDMRVDDRGFTGGVGYGAEGGGGGGGGFMDGYGQIHFANGGSVENGPTYNSYGQSFQFNPSQAGPFQPRLMGGFAPRK